MEWHRTGDVGHVDDAGRLWVEGRLAHVVATADGPVTPVPLEIAVTEATGLRCAVTGVGPVGCEQVVVVVEDEGKAGLASPVIDQAVREALPHQPLAAVLAVPSPPGRRSPQLEGRPHAARPLGGQAARGRLRAEARLMRVLVTGGSGLLGRRTIARARRPGARGGGAPAPPR